MTRHAEQRQLRIELDRPLIDRRIALEDARTLGRISGELMFASGRHAGTHPDPVAGCHTCELLHDMQALLAGGA